MNTSSSSRVIYSNSEERNIRLPFCFFGYHFVFFCFSLFVLLFSLFVLLFRLEETLKLNFYFVCVLSFLSLIVDQN